MSTLNIQTLNSLLFKIKSYFKIVILHNLCTCYYTPPSDYFAGGIFTLCISLFP